MYKIKSAKEAVEITLKLWQYLAKYPQKRKRDWPGWKKYGTMSALCPLCEFAGKGIGGFICRNCPLYGRWVTGVDTDCCHYKSPYAKWIDATLDDVLIAKHRYAKQVVNKLKGWLQEHS